MKIIISRKGFDSAAGKCASPIFEDGSMCSLPIPSRHSPVCFKDVTIGGRPLGAVVSDLSRGRTPATYGVHFDPDLDASSWPRAPGWRGLFGQGGNAQKVLAREGVAPGDVFVFFGWFRRVEQVSGRFRFVKGAPNLHVVWGWLQVDRVIDVATSRASVPSWATYHPHVAHGSHITNNTLYVATDRLVLGDIAVGISGGGVLPTFADRLQLTKPGARRSTWSLPAWFHRDASRPPLGLHGDLGRWTRAGDRVDLESVARGLEFVLDTAKYPEAAPWLRALLAPSGE